ncbi:MAG: response regulator [Arachnia sp.]
MITILIVEDDDDVRSLIQVAFRLTDGWQVIMADSLASAKRELESRSIDIVLTDNELGDGWAADVRALATCPVVVVSASIAGQGSSLVPLEGYAGGIAKPFNPLTLPALVISVLDAGGPPS